MLLVVIFVTVPILVFEQFRAVDEEKTDLILRIAHDQGRLIAASLSPLFTSFSPAVAAKLGEALASIAGTEGKTKILFRPKGARGNDSFYYVAAMPEVPTGYLELERAELISTGVLDRVREACAGVGPVAARYINPSGEEELLTSLTPYNSDAGCWVVITSRSTADFLGSTLARPYWSAPEIRFAAAIYVLMAAFVVWLFADVWRGLRRFERLARAIATKGPQDRSFAEANKVPELGGVAREFDRLTDKLHGSAELIRHAAEENAHAFKTPIAAIAQSLEPIRRGLAGEDSVNARAIERIDQSVQRLDSLVAAARRIDEASAELLDPRSERIALGPMIERICESYRDALDGKGPEIVFEGGAAATVLAGHGLLETTLENLLHNAISFSPPEGTVRVVLERRGRTASVDVEDDGPGVAPERLEHIFDRYYSYRPDGARLDGNGDDGAHFGIGLWVVRRNIESVGGTVTAENLPARGFRVRLSIPTA